MKKLRSISRRHFSRGLAGTFMAAVLPEKRSFLAGESKSKLNLSLAQWSLHRSIFAGEIKPFDFPLVAKEEFDLHAVEYVNQFYTDYKNDEGFWNQLRGSCDRAGVSSLLVMVDEEGDLGDGDAEKRHQAVENHYAWIDAAKLLGCHSIRVNAFGAMEADALSLALVDGLGRLTEYSSKEGVHVLIENHGLHSSDADFIVDVIRQVDSPYLGTLPDFGNWCMSEKWGSTKEDNCADVFNIYEGVQKFLPFAKGVSAKSYDFSQEGGQPRIDYRKMLKLVHDSEFSGYIGIEYEGTSLGEVEGIHATKNLLNEVWHEINR